MSVSSRSSTIFSLFTPDELALEREWLKIRDLLLGLNNVAQDVKRALELAALCQHRDAVYLTEIFAGKGVNTKEQAREVFLAQPEDEARALCFSELVLSDDIDDWDLLRVRRSAELGFAFGQAMMEDVTKDADQKFRFAQISARKRERDGFRLLGFCFHCGCGCEINRYKAVENYLLAAELGHVYAMCSGGRFLHEANPQHWLWLGRAAQKGYTFDFLRDFCVAVNDFKSGRVISAVCIFQIGRALNGQVDVVQRQILGEPSDDFDSHVGPANDAIALYKSQLAACKSAIDTWTLVGIRNHVVKDIRILIGKMIWELRDLAEYK